MIEINWWVIGKATVFPRQKISKMSIFRKVYNIFQVIDFKCIKMTHPVISE